MKKLLPIIIGVALSTPSAFVYADDLMQVYEQAKKSDPTLLQAAANKDAAFAKIGISKGSLLPQIDLTAGYTLVRNTDAGGEAGDLSDTNTLSAAISLSQELYNRSSWVNLDLAELTARQSDAVYAAQQQALILRVATAYFGVLSANDDLIFVRAEKTSVGRQLEQTKQRFEVGLSAITDVHEAQAQYDSVLASEILSENELINSYEALREITGISHKDLKILNTKSFSASPTKEKIDALTKQAEEKNLTLLAQRITRDLAKESISLADSSHLPSLTFSAGYSYSNLKNTTIPEYGATNGKLTTGLNFSMPLYSGGTISANVEQAKFSYVSASEALEATYRSILKDVRAYYNNINANIGALKAYEQTVISQRSALKATEAGFEVGTRTIVDVLEATRKLYDANRNLSDARYNYILSMLQLRQATGSLSEQDLADINSGLMSDRVRN